MEQVYEITGYESVPEELKAVNNWIVWKREPTDKLDKNGEVRFKKVPYSPKTDDKASPTDPNAGSDFNTALSKEIDYDGLGFIFTGSPFLGVDLDNISNEIKEFESGNENNIVGEFYNQLETYTELSPSGTGLHFIMRGELPLGGRHKGDVEMYDTGRFFTITGDQFGDYENINNGTELIKPLHEKYLGSNDGVQGDYTDFEKIPSFGNGLSEDEVILALNKDPQSVIWLGLFFTGDYKAAGYSSRSEAELAFVGKLGFYSDYDKNMMDNIFKQSALCDEKWERASSPTKVYTIGRVINNRPKKGGYKSKKKNNFNITVNQNTDDWNSRKWEIIANKQKRKPTNEGSSTLIDGNGVLWVEKDGGKINLLKLYWLEITLTTRQWQV
ncbi:hypothetical protein ACF3NG_10105 [Aerococcaceae bacterium WGS1372]